MTLMELRVKSSDKSPILLSDTFNQLAIRKFDKTLIYQSLIFYDIRECCPAAKMNSVEGE